MTTLKDKKIVQLKLDPTHRQVVSTANLFVNYWGRLRDICVSPDGRIFVATNGASWSNTQPFTHSIIEIKNSNYTRTTTLPSATTSLHLQPNPTSSQSQLTVPQELVGQPYVVCSSLGQIVLEGTLEATTTLSSQFLSKGVYIIHVPHCQQPTAIRWMVR